MMFVSVASWGERNSSSGQVRGGYSGGKQALTLSETVDPEVPGFGSDDFFFCAKKP